MSRRYQVVKTVTLRCVRKIGVLSEKAIGKATGGNSRGFAVGVGLLHHDYVDVHFVAAPSFDVGAASWLVQEARCSAWLARLRSGLNGFGSASDSAPLSDACERFQRNPVQRAADIGLIDG